MRREKKEMLTAESLEYGYIPVDVVAKKETVKVFAFGEEIVPDDFTIAGEPIFSKVKTLLYSWKKKQELREGRTEPSIEICYEEYTAEEIMGLFAEEAISDSCKFKGLSPEEETKEKFWEAKKNFDTVEGIERSLADLDTFWKMLKERNLCAQFKEIDFLLGEYVVFGKYYLDRYGQILKIENADYVQEEPWIPKVCGRNEFDILTNSYHVSEEIMLLPKSGESCACCGRKFEIADLENGLEEIYLLDSSEMAHKKCYENFYRQLEIENITGIVDMAYPEKPKMELIPNRVNHKSRIPWFLFHTSDGDIIIGHKSEEEDAISIEWQENFKTFNMAIFNSEKTDKWQDSQTKSERKKGNVIPCYAKRGILADSEGKAFSYLKIVSLVVNGKLSSDEIKLLCCEQLPMDFLILDALTEE